MTSGQFLRSLRAMSAVVVGLNHDEASFYDPAHGRIARNCSMPDIRD